MRHGGVVPEAVLPVVLCRKLAPEDDGGAAVDGRRQGQPLGAGVVQRERLVNTIFRSIN